MALAVNRNDNYLLRIQMLNSIALQAKKAQAAQASQTTQANSNLNAPSGSALDKIENNELVKEIRDYQKEALSGLVTGGPAGAVKKVAKKFTGIKGYGEMGSDMRKNAESKETKHILSDFDDAGKRIADDIRKAKNMRTDKKIVTALRVPSRIGNAVCNTAGRVHTDAIKNVVGEKTAKVYTSGLALAGTIYEAPGALVKKAVDLTRGVRKGAFKTVKGIFTFNGKDIKEGWKQIKEAGKQFGKDMKELGKDIWNKTKQFGKDVGQLAKKIGQGITQGIKTLVTNPKEAIKKIGQGIKNKAKKIGKFFKGLFRRRK